MKVERVMWALKDVQGKPIGVGLRHVKNWKDAKLFLHKKDALDVALATDEPVKVRVTIEEL